VIFPIQAPPSQDILSFLKGQEDSFTAKNKLIKFLNN